MIYGDLLHHLIPGRALIATWLRARDTYGDTYIGMLNYKSPTVTLRVDIVTEVYSDRPQN